MGTLECPISKAEKEAQPNCAQKSSGADLIRPWMKVVSNVQLPRAAVIARRIVVVLRLGGIKSLILHIIDRVRPSVVKRALKTVPQTLR